MAMTVTYNAGAQFALGELNKNSSKLGKALSKISSGQRIVGADDSGSDYSISESMRTRIRALSQDNQNVQNGSSMLRIAERGVDRIVQTLRTMKELAIDAANDSNTDEDRQTIQKELDQCRATINDIAIGSQYNGKILLDGRWVHGGLLPPRSGSGGANTTVENIVGGLKAGANARAGSSTESGGSGAPDAWKFDIDNSFGGTNFSVELDFSAMKVKGSYPTALHNQGFTILCDGCPQYINIRFDATKTTAQSTYDKTPGVAEDGTINDMAREFIIGVQTVRNASDLSNAIFEGISAVSGQIEKSFRRTIGGSITYTSSHVNKSDDILINASHSLRIRREGKKVFLTKNGNEMQFKEGTIPNPLTDPIPPVKLEETAPNPLWIHHGTQAGQRVHIYINDMQSKALGIDEAEVTTKEKANSAISIITGAIETALNEATNLGAYLQRLETTDTNITTMGENVQAAESTIRDADMAKEMVEYTKYNLLTQSSQTMLAQANQNGSSVLGLLQ